MPTTYIFIIGKNLFQYFNLTLTMKERPGLMVEKLAFQGEVSRWLNTFSTPRPGSTTKCAIETVWRVVRSHWL